MGRYFDELDQTVEYGESYGGDYTMDRKDKEDYKYLKRMQEKRNEKLELHRFSGKKPVVHISITTPVLAKLFNVKEYTVHNWIRNKRLDPSNLLDIIEKYNNPHLLDRRRRT